MGAINDAFNKAGWSILSLASATAKYRARRNEEGKNRAKLNYSTAATIKKQNNELTKKQSENPKSYFDINSPLLPEKDEQKIAEQKVLKQIAQEKAKKPVQRFGELAGVEKTFKQADAPTEKEVVEAKKPVQSFGELAGVEEAPAPEQKVLEQMVQERAKATSFDELPTVSAEHSETNIDAKDPEVQGLIELKQKNALRAAAGQRSQKRYQDIKERLTYRFADEHNIYDVWRNISLDPDITDEMIRKAGYTKTKILEEWKWYNDSPTDWLERLNTMGDEYWIGGGIAEAEEGSNFGRLLSAYIKAKVRGKTLAQQQEEYDLSKAEKEPDELYESIGEAMEEHELKQAKNKKPSVDDWYRNFGINNSKMSDSSNYKVWQDESTEEEKDEEKKDKGIIF